MTQQLQEQGITTEMSALSGGVQYGILYDLPDACEQSFVQEKQAGVCLFVRHGHRQLLKPDNLVRL